MNSENIKSLIKAAGENGKFFTVKFLKKDGTKRTLNGRLGVTNCLAGGKATTGDEYVKIFDAKIKQYRNVNPDTVYEIKGNGINFSK